jgi:hypothetical protein
LLLSVFVVLLGLTGFLLWLGYAHDAQSFQLISLFFLFVLALNLMGGGVMVPIGSNSTPCSYNETYTYSEGLLVQVETFYGGCIEETATAYQAVDDQWTLWMGRFLALGAALAIIYFFFTLRSRRMTP